MAERLCSRRCADCTGASWRWFRAGGVGAAPRRSLATAWHADVSYGNLLTAAYGGVRPRIDEGDFSDDCPHPYSRRQVLLRSVDHGMAGPGPVRLGHPPGPGDERAHP